MKFLTPEYIKENVWLTEFSREFDLERYNNEDTLRIEFEPTQTLDNEADRIRKADGYHGLFDGSNFDLEGWYNFFATITETEMVDMYFETENTKEDSGLYYFDVDEETKQLLYYKVVSIVGADRWREIWK